VRANPDLEGFLDCYLIGDALVTATFFPANDAAGAYPLPFGIRKVHVVTIARLTKWEKLPTQL
jgi:hypothetical protein